MSASQNSIQALDNALVSLDAIADDLFDARRSDSDVCNKICFHTITGKIAKLDKCIRRHRAAMALMEVD